MKVSRVERGAFVLLVAGLGFFVLAFVGLGVTPWVNEHEQIAAHASTETVAALTPLQMEGRQLYMADGCDYCHSQFVRPVGDDALRYGAVSKSWEYKDQYPHLLGTRRIGPDLTREGGVHSDDWQYAHLYDPRQVVSWSMMPSFPWLFKGPKHEPTHQARALVAYLQTLGQDRRQHMLADGNLKQRFIPGIGTVDHYVYHGDTLRDPGYDHVVYFKDSGRPADTAAMRRRGAQLYQLNCATCHGDTADGNGPAAAYLQPSPVRLTAFRISAPFLYQVLYYGRPGTSMPSWVHSFDSFLSPKDLWSLAYYVQGLYQPDAVPAGTPAPSYPPAMTTSLVARGKTVFAANCAACHGATGQGNGVAAQALSPAPINFTDIVPSVRWAYEIVSNGRPGTAMGAFQNLSPKDRWAVAYYLQTLYRGDRPAAIAHASPVNAAPAKARLAVNAHSVMHSGGAL